MECRTSLLDGSADVSDPEVLFLSDGRDGSVEVYFWDSGFQYSDATLSCRIARDGACVSVRYFQCEERDLTNREPDTLLNHRRR